MAELTVQQRACEEERAQKARVHQPRETEHALLTTDGRTSLHVPQASIITGLAQDIKKQDEVYEKVRRSCVRDLARPFCRD